MPLAEPAFRRRRTRSPRVPVPQGATAGSTIPYEYAAAFKMTGTPGNVLEDVINISPEGVFVAVAIGYGFEENRGRPVPFPRVVGTVPVVPGDITLDQVPQSALIDGFRVNPRFDDRIFEPVEGDLPVDRRVFSTIAVPPGTLGNALERLKAPEDISFLISTIDSGTGRELQDQPVHNLASLGKSNGERPFRPLVQPLSFLPRSTIRIQIIERSEGAKGTLFVVLFGYKILAPGCAEPIARAIGRNRRRSPRSARGAVPGGVPFDYVATFELSGRSGTLVEDEIPINVEGGFVATSLGYGLSPRESDVPLQVPPGAEFDLAALRLNQFPPSALVDGVRIRPNLVRIAFQNNGDLASRVPANVADKLFERLNRPEDVSFLYTIVDSGTGRGWQNRAIHNVAGLGIADGDRPFKKLARPMLFLPRSTISVQIEERLGRGTLFLVFQGYKILGGRR